MPDISVIVPFYNAEPYLTMCIEALLSQRYPIDQYEIVMVDNNSIDNSIEIVQSYPRIKLVSQEKQGAYAARNRGLMEVNSDIIAFTDPDCVPSRDWLQRIKESMTCYGIGVLIGNHGLPRYSLLLSMLADYENEKNNYIFNSDIKELYYGYTRNMAVQKRLFDEIGLFVEIARGSDVIFVRRCIDMYSCKAVRYCPEVQVQHMELDSIRKYFRKVFIYGRSIEGYRRIASVRSLTNWERFLVLKKILKGYEYSWMKSIILIGILMTGALYWTIGRMSEVKIQDAKNIHYLE